MTRYLLVYCCDIREESCTESKIYGGTGRHSHLRFSKGVCGKPTSALYSTNQRIQSVAHLLTLVAIFFCGYTGGLKFKKTRRLKTRLKFPTFFCYKLLWKCYLALKACIIFKPLSGRTFGKTPINSAVKYSVNKEFVMLFVGWMAHLLP